MEQERTPNVELVRKYRREDSGSKHISLLWWFTGIALAALLVVAFYCFYHLGYSEGRNAFRGQVADLVGQITHTKVPPKLEGEVDFKPFWDAWLLLEKNFAEGANSTSTDLEVSSEQDRVWGAISGLTASYKDPFTSFLPPEENEFFAADISGEFTGVGMEIGNRDQLLTIIAPIPGTPAARSGLRPLDVISKINDTDSLRMPVERAVRLIRGPQGETVNLTILRQGESEEREIVVTRELINIPTIETALLEDVFVIKLFSFSAKSPDLFYQALKEFQVSGASYLLLDLRSNPGGFLEAAIDISSRFLNKDRVVVQERHSGERKDRVRYSLGHKYFDNPFNMVVLIDAGSASASEIVAGALRDNSVALVLGQKSFGKGSVQELFPLTRDTALKITIAKWLTPKGISISAHGIVPDITLDEYVPKEGDYAGTYSQDLAKDYQIQQSVEILRHPNFASFLQEVPTEVQNKYRSSVE